MLTKEKVEKIRKDMWEGRANVDHSRQRGVEDRTVDAVLLTTLYLYKEVERLNVLGKAAHDNATELASQVSRLELQVRDYDLDTEQFNDGFSAFGEGKPCEPPAYDRDMDAWEVGWAWAKHCREVGKGLRHRTKGRTLTPLPDNPHLAVEEFCRGCEMTKPCDCSE